LKKLSLERYNVLTKVPINDNTPREQTKMSKIDRQLS